MKTTLEIDDDLVRRVMEPGGIRTKTDAIEFALTSTERLLRRRRLLEERLSPEEIADSIDPACDLTALRESDVPH